MVFSGSGSLHLQINQKKKFEIFLKFFGSRTKFGTAPLGSKFKISKKKQKLIKREPRRSKTSICITESGKKFLLGVKELVKNSRAKDIDAWAMIGLPGFLD